MLPDPEVHIRQPREDEFPLLIELRNRTRHWFGDQSELKPDEAVKWLAARHDEDALMCIVLDGLIVGTIGWVRIPIASCSYELGRGIANYHAVRDGSGDHRRLHRAVRIAGCLALDHLFGTLGAGVVYARTRAGNNLVRKLVSEFDWRSCAWPLPSSTDQLECWRIAAEDWPITQAKILRQSTS